MMLSKATAACHSSAPNCPAPLKTLIRSCPAAQVVIIAAPKAGEAIPSFDDLMAQKAALWQKPKWAPGVLARREDTIPFPQNRSRRIPVHLRLLQMTALACPECDTTGQHPLPNMKVLQDHLAFMHGGMVMCPVCITAHRK